MDKWKKAEVGRGRGRGRGEEKRREERRKKREERRKKKEERVRRKKMQVRETVEKSRNTLCLQCSVAPESKSRLAKAAGAEPSGEMREEKLHVVVARSTFGSQNSKSTTGSDHSWVVDMSKKCMPLWHEAHFEVKNVQNTPFWEHFWKLRCWKVKNGALARSRFRSQKC